MMEAQRAPEQEKKKKPPRRTSSTVTTLLADGGDYTGVANCASDQCFAPMPSSPSHPMEAAPAIYPLSSPEVLWELIPYDLYHAMKEAAKQGFLVSFLLTFTNEGLTDFLTERHYTADQIYWITQAIRTITLVAIGTSPLTALATPLSTYILSRYLGLCKENANYLTTAAAVSLSIITSPTHLVHTSATIVTAVAASVAGGKIADYSYQWTRNTFFSQAPPEASQTQSLAALSVLTS